MASNTTIESVDYAQIEQRLLASLTPEEHAEHAELSRAEGQLALERECLSSGQERYWKGLAEHRAQGTEDRTAPVLQLIRRSIATVAEAIRIKIDGQTGKAGPRFAAKPLIANVPYEVLAFHTLRAALRLASDTKLMTSVSVALGTVIMEERNFGMWEAQDDRRYRTTQQHIKSSTTGDRKRAIMRRMMKLSEVDGALAWGDADKVRVGAFLIDCLLQSTTLFETRLMKVGKDRVRILAGTAELLNWLGHAHDRASLFVPLRLPMIVKPRAWVSPQEGGYLSDVGGRLTMLKTRNKAYLRALDDVAMPKVYDALNSIQSTPWAINAAVLSVATHCWEQGASVGSAMPSRDPEPLPALPVSEEEMKTLRETDYAAYKAWAARAAAVHERNGKLVGKRMACVEKLNIAARFAEHAAIYFPHQMDFRGRVYPIPAHLNPQGDDLARGLLRFSEGKPLGERGLFWLKVHIANCFGVDKVSMADRVAWVDAHSDQLMESGLSATDAGAFWRTAEDPWQALAAVLEFTGAIASGDPSTFVSHLSIPMDGSCNGLQNFSAMLRDGVGGKATNLLPSDKPADIYSEVARVVAKQVSADAQTGNPYASVWDGKLSRKLVKQPVMTLPYGATKAGMRGQIEAALRKNHPGLFPQNEVWAACGYLADVTYTAIGLVVVAARQAMDWLQEAARCAASEDFPIHWTTPMGLPVLQEYRQLISKPVKVHVDGASQRLFVANEGDKLDRRRQAQGISPNLVHSLDASHMMATVLLAAENGVAALSLIHDSYGTHACDTDTLHACIREAFVDQYSGDVLAKFRDELIEQLPPNTELPPLPPMGDLDLTAVKQSRYFFA